MSNLHTPPCPFCLSWATAWYIGGLHPNCVYQVHCKMCRAAGPRLDNQELALQGWADTLGAVADAHTYSPPASREDPLDILIREL